FSSTPTGVINDSTDVSLGIATLPVVKVDRGQLGIAATSHAVNAIARVHRGAFNIVESTVFFSDPPKGNNRSRRDETNLPFVRANFSGRTFLRSDYTTNMLFDDISDNFTGIGKTYSLTVGGANTASGIGVGNGVLFINGVFQTPKTVNNTGSNYEFISDTTAGISTVVFSGITSTNGDFIVSEFDINQNQVPRGGLIVSLGSTPGTGYAPLQGAKVKAFKDANGGITSVVGIATSSGFNLGIQTAAYDNVTGIITVTTDKVHGFALERPNTVKLKNLEFSCVGYSGVTTTIFQDHERPLFLVGIVSDRTFEVQAGPSTIFHTYVGGGHAFEFFEDLTFGSGYRGGSVAIGVTDQAYVHRFVSAGIGSIRKGNFAATGANSFTATNAVYTSHSGKLVLTIPNHGLSTSDTVGIDTGGLVFKCSKDNFFSDHPYPRAVSKTSFPNSDPIAGIQTAITATTTNTITLNVGAGGGGGTGAEISAIVGAGGTLAFTITSAGSGYVNPEIVIPEPNYDNLPVIGISRQGIGATTETGSNLLVDVKVSAAKTTVGIGSTTFEISEFAIARPGHSFKIGDKFKPVGLVTAAHLSAPIQEFELEVTQIFQDKFSSWQFGEIDFIDTIKNLQDGSRTRFPLFFNGQLLSFEKDLNDATSQLIDLNAVLLIFVNGVLQVPGSAYTFEGGTTFEFEEAPRPEAQVDIFFYKGEDGVDVDTADIQQTVKTGDEVRLFKHPVGFTTSQQAERTIKELLGAKLVETDIYTGQGIDATNDKPLRWTKQKVDIILGGKKIDKSREILEPQVYPTAKIIGDFTTSSGQGNTNGIFVDDAEVFFYEKGDHLSASNPDETDGDYNLSFNTIDALVTSGEINVGASATAIVNANSSVSLHVTNRGSGYTSVPTIKISAPPRVGVGIGTTAVATGTISNGILATVNAGAGIDANNNKPLRWTKQKVDIVLGGKKIDKSREILEPQIYPTAKIIGDFTSTSGQGSTNGIFVDDAEVFFYEKGDHLSASNPDETDGDYNLSYSTVDALVTSGEINVGASATAIVNANTSVSLNITNGGSGYTSVPTIKISAPPRVGVGIGTTAVATGTITNGVLTSVNAGAGFGYSATNPPQVIIESPEFKIEKITSISNVEGFTGIITGISTTTVSGQSALKFFFRADKTANTLLV
ncbi:MAG: hypothetical protein VXY51_10645, partial [Pseudomonadota bacterium]|nr:hypothetical protein [Pseudomonadota bacterium]